MGLRENILKFRQPGFSTIIDALLYLWATENRNFKAWIVGGDEDGAKLLFEMVQRFHQHDRRKLATRYNREDKLAFGDIGSELSVWSAGKLRLGRGTTLSALHMSELAWWNSLAVRGGLLQAVPVHGNVFEETTAHGFNEYEKKYQADKLGETNFRAWFFPWNIFPAYSREPEPDFKPDEDERRLMATYDLTPGQIAWRRDKKRELDTTETPFEQEYPLTDSEAFVASGNPFFDREVLIQRRDELQKQSLGIEGLVFHPDHAPRMRKAYAEGQLEIYQVPQHGRYYILTGDPIYDRPEGDYCSSDVLDADAWEQVMHLNGKWEPHEYGLLLAEIGEWYNMALIAVLRIAMGVSTIDALTKVANYPLQRGRGLSGVFCFYPSELKLQAKPDDAHAIFPGWPENEMTKAWMLDKLSRAITIIPGLTINSLKTVTEMLTFVHLPGGKAGGEAGSHDDCVSSLALGAALLNLRFERTDQRAVIQPRKPVAGYGALRSTR